MRHERGGQEDWRTEERQGGKKRGRERRGDKNEELKDQKRGRILLKKKAEQRKLFSLDLKRKREESLIVVWLLHLQRRRPNKQQILRMEGC